VRPNGRLYDAAAALRVRRPPSALYHSALEVDLGGKRYVIEMSPVWNEHAPGRGVVAEGAVGSRLAGRLRLFRYEVRCWRDGRIPDVTEAVDRAGAGVAADLVTALDDQQKRRSAGPLPAPGLRRTTVPNARPS
jgi:hypothetical protein